jgi:hypothetical protein
VSDFSPTTDPLAERLTRLEQKFADLADRSAPSPVLLAPAGAEPPGLFHPATARALVPVSPPQDHTPWSWAHIGQTLRLIVHMYFDPRYRLSRLAQIGVPAVILAAVLNYLFWNYLAAIPVVSQLFERAGLVVLAVVLYKLLAKESLRYKAVLDYLARYG